MLDCWLLIVETVTEIIYNWQLLCKQSQFTEQILFCLQTFRHQNRFKLTGKHIFVTRCGRPQSNAGTQSTKMCMHFSFLLTHSRHKTRTADDGMQHMNYERTAYRNITFVLAIMSHKYVNCERRILDWADIASPSVTFPVHQNWLYYAFGFQS